MSNFDDLAMAVASFGGNNAEMCIRDSKYASTYVFPAGVVLTIPEVEDEEDLELPPWKRGLLTQNERKRHGTPGGTAVEISKRKSPGRYK